MEEQLHTQVNIVANELLLPKRFSGWSAVINPPTLPIPPFLYFHPDYFDGGYMVILHIRDIVLNISNITSPFLLPSPQWSNIEVEVKKW